MPVLVKSELCCCKFQKGSIHFIKRGLGRSDQAAASDTDTHASRWTVLLKLKQVVEAKGNDLLCSKR
jgi:hypothetical protein